MRLGLSELRKSNEESKKIRVKGLKDGYKEVDGVLHHQRLLFVPEVIRTKFISRHHNNPLASHFGIDKTRKLISRKYYWPSLRKDVEAYIKDCNICLGLKAVKHKPYSNLQMLLVPTYQWKDFLMDFIMRLPVSTN